jgi:hypothetical protein
MQSSGNVNETLFSAIISAINVSIKFWYSGAGSFADARVKTNGSYGGTLLARYRVLHAQVVRDFL